MGVYVRCCCILLESLLASRIGAHGAIVKGKIGHDAEYMALPSNRHSIHRNILLLVGVREICLTCFEDQNLQFLPFFYEFYVKKRKKKTGTISIFEITVKPIKIKYFLMSAYIHSNAKFNLDSDFSIKRCLKL